MASLDARPGLCEKALEKPLAFISTTARALPAQHEKLVFSALEAPLRPPWPCRWPFPGPCIRSGREERDERVGEVVAVKIGIEYQVGGVPYRGDQERISAIRASCSSRRPRAYILQTGGLESRNSPPQGVPEPGRAQTRTQPAIRAVHGRDVGGNARFLCRQPVFEGGIAARDRTQHPRCRCTSRSRFIRGRTYSMPILSRRVNITPS